MVINHGEERKQHQWGPALFLGDNLSAAGSCYGMELSPGKKDRAGILAGLGRGSLQMDSEAILSHPGLRNQHLTHLHWIFH